MAAVKETPEHLKEMQDLYENHHEISLIKLADHFHMETSSIGSYARRYGWKPRGKNRRGRRGRKGFKDFTAEQIAGIKEMYIGGYRVENITKRFGVSQSQLDRLREQEGWTKRRHVDNYGVDRL